MENGKNETKPNEGLCAMPRESMTGTSSGCEPGCDCGPPSGGTKIKTAVSLIVLLAVVGILAYKATTAKKNAPDNLSADKTSVFSVAQAAPEGALGESAQTSTAMKENKAGKSANSKAQADATSSLDPPSPKAANRESATEAQLNMQDEAEAHPVKASQKIGEDLESLSALNKVAMDQDAVFVFIPGPESEPADDKTNTAVLAAQRTLKRNNVTLGLYTLRAGSPGYSAISKQVQLPAILVASKGRGMAAASGDMTETKLLQAFMASCGPSGCGPSGCGPVDCEPTPVAGK